MFLLREEIEVVEVEYGSLFRWRLLMFTIALVLGGLVLSLLSTEISALVGVQGEAKDISPAVPAEVASLESDKELSTTDDEFLVTNDERYESLKLDEADKLLLAQMIYHEARSEPRAGQIALVEVTLNRVLDPSFPETVEEVIYQEGQYVTAGLLVETEPLPEQFEAIEAVLDGEYVLPEALEDGRLVVFFAKSAENSYVAAKIGAHVFCYAYDWTS